MLSYKLYKMPDHVPENIKVFLSQINYSGKDNFKEVIALQEIIKYISSPASKEDIESYLMVPQEVIE